MSGFDAVSSIASLATKKTWQDSEPLECVAIVHESPDVATFSFRAPSGAMFDYQPGQFVTLEIPAPSGTVYRTYTLSSSPSRPLTVSITAKAQRDSIGTRWMIDSLKPGMQLQASGPNGDFSFVHHPSDKYLFISAGSGITPMMSMTQHMYDQGLANDIVFINCARRPSEIIFLAGLERMASRSPGIDLKFVVEEPDPFQPWVGYQGFFNQLMLGLMAPDYLEREVFCCGPAPFMQAVREALIALGFDMDHYHQESFAPEPPVVDDITPELTTSSSVRFSLSDKVASCAETDTILVAARTVGLNIPSGCQFGVCGTCKVKKQRGEVHMVHNGGISEDDIEQGYILACCSHPLGSVEIEV